jgi:3-deoxy-7-phosphoheptulonate synthase
MAVAGSVWSPSSWRSYPALHQPEWPSEERAETARARLASVPPLVFAGEARGLRASLADVAAGRAFLLQAGDCAESFHDVSAIHIREKLKILLQMAAVLTYGAQLPVVKVGRIAGQFAKARSSPKERAGDEEIPSFRGHMIHDDTASPEARIPDPERMVHAYYHATSILNLMRAFTREASPT